MTEDTFNQLQKAGKVERIEKPQSNMPPPPFSPDEHQPFLEALRRPKRHLTTAPNFTPKNFLEQIQFVDDGDLKVYFYINNTWGYITLT